MAGFNRSIVLNVVGFNTPGQHAVSLALTAQSRMSTTLNVSQAR